MTYQEIKDRLTKCESTLESLKNGSYSNIQPTEVQKTVKQLKVLQESLQSQLAEASKKTYLVTPKSGETSALSLDDKEVDALEDADDIEGIKGADGSEVKEMSDDEFAQAQQNQRLEDHPEKDMIKKIQALIAKERGIKEKEGATAGEEEKFHTKLDTLVHSTFGKSKEEEDMNEAPVGMSYIEVSVRDARKAMEIMDDLHKGHFEMNGSNVYYFKDDSMAYDAMMDLGARGIEIVDTNIEEEVKEGEETPEGGMDQGGDFDVAHQDDEPNMLKKDIYDIATYAAKLYKQLDKYDKHDGEVDFPHWWQKKVTLAREYISSAQHFLEAEEKQPALDQLALEESKLNEMVDPSYADMLAQFIILMGSGYGALQAVKKLGDETGDISLDSVKKAIKKHKSGDVSEIGMFHDPIGYEKPKSEKPTYTKKYVSKNVYDIFKHGKKVKTVKGSEGEANAWMNNARKGQQNEAAEGQSISELKPGDKFEYNGKTYTLVKHKEGNIATVILPNGDTSTVSFGGKINTGKKAGIGPDYFGQGKGHHIDEASLAKIQKAHSLVVAKMKELVQHYKTGDTSVVPQLKDLTAKKKELERQLDDKVAGTGRDQELDVNEEKATYCGGCGTTHKKSSGCPK